MKNRLARNGRNGKSLSLRNLSVAALAGLAFMGASWNQSTAAQTQTQISPVEKEKFVTEQVKLTNLREGEITGAAADLTPTIDALHAADPENNPQESVFEYVDSEDDANTNIEINYKDYDAETGEITGDVTKYINLKQTEYVLGAQPTLDMLNAQDAETYPRGSAYTFKDTAEDSNTGMPVVTQYIVDKTNPDAIFTAGQPKYLDINKTTYNVGDNEYDITYSWSTEDNRLSVTVPVSTNNRVYNNGRYTSIVSGDIEDDFVGLSQSDSGGAIYNYIYGYSGSVSIPTIKGDFIGNSANGNGGAIGNINGGYGNKITIESIEGNFIGNKTTKGSGAAIYNSSYNNIEIGSLKGDFIGNSSTSYGGALYSGKIGSITGDFVGNTANYGGAIYQAQVDSIKGNFINNSATNGNGGAIYSAGIKNLEGNFIGNTSQRNMYGGGGAISGTSFDNLIGNFIDNHAYGDSSNGGALESVRTDYLEGNFIGNSADGYGGAIYGSGYIVANTLNGNFIDNHAGQYGGAVYQASVSSLTGDFVGNSAVKAGGALHSGYFNDITGDFIGNYAYNDNNVNTDSYNEVYQNGATGGAIANAEFQGSVNSNFIGNHVESVNSSALGGAIYSSKINELNGDFIGNWARGKHADGGAIYVEEYNDIGTINGNFISNWAHSTGTTMSHGGEEPEIVERWDGNGPECGGAIYNTGVINEINGDFVDNHYEADYVQANGGAIYNAGGASIGYLNGNFNANYAIAGDNSAGGGAIYNAFSTIGDIDGNFVGNYARGKHADGGAIYNHGLGAVIGNITGDFIDNWAESYGYEVMHNQYEDIIPILSAEISEGASCGGAIYNYAAKIGDIAGNFTGNHYLTETVQANGGAIFNSNGAKYDATIGTISGVFDGNYAISNHGDANGGAIYNTGTIGKHIIEGIPATYYTQIITDEEGNQIATLYSAYYHDKENEGDIQLSSEDIQSGVYTFTSEEVYTNSIDEIEGWYGIGQDEPLEEEYTPEENTDYQARIANIVEVFAEDGWYLVYENPESYNFVAEEEDVLGISNSSFVNNYAKAEDGVAHGGAVYTATDLTLSSTDGHEFLIDGNYVEDKDGTRPEAVYVDTHRELIEGEWYNKGAYLDPDTGELIWVDNIYNDRISLNPENPTLTINANTGGTFVINDQIVGSPTQEPETFSYTVTPYAVNMQRYLYKSDKDFSVEDRYVEKTHIAIFNEETGEWSPSLSYEWYSWDYDYNETRYFVHLYDEAKSEWVTTVRKYDSDTNEFLGYFNADTDELVYGPDTMIAVYHSIDENVNREYYMYNPDTGEEEVVYTLEPVTTEKQYIEYNHTVDAYVPVDEPEMETVTLGGKAKLAIKGDETGKVYINNNIKNLDITHNDVTTTVSDYMFLNQTDDGSINSLTMNSGTLNLGVMGLTPLHFENFSMNGGIINIDSIEVDLANKIMGRITADNYTDALGGVINVRALSLTSDSADTLTVVAFADEAFKNTVVSHVTEAFTPIYRYEVEYDTNKQYGEETEEGYFVFKRPGNDDTVPGGDDTVPGGDDTVPGGDDTVPGGDDTIPGGDDTIPGGDDTIPGGDDTVPGGDDTIPGGDETIPGGDDTIPGGDDTIPGGDDTIPGGDDTIPGGDDTIPGGDDTVPGGDDTIPGGDDTIPGGDDTIPGGDDTIPGGDDTIPGGDDTIPGGDDEPEPDPVDPRIHGGGTGGHGGNPSKRFNPAVLASPVATQAAGQATMNQTFQYVFEHADVFTQLPAIDRFAQIHNNEYALSTDYNTNMGQLDFSKDNKGVWVRPYTSFDKTDLKNGPEVKSINYGTIIGGDSEFRKLGHGWTNVGTAYAGYFGSQADHEHVSTTVNGGLLGVTETFYKGNFFTALTASVGGGFAESHTMYGKDDITMLMAGVASKSGYNFEFKEGKFIIQPLLMMNYTMVNTFDYTNAAGVKIDSDPLHTIQLNPSVRFIGNIKGGWQPYASVGMVWNLMNETNVRANGVELPSMHTKPYVEYGVGIQRHWNDRFSAFGQAMIRNGGRTGVAFTAGFRWALGGNKQDVDNDKNVKLDGNKQVTVIKGERSKSTGAAVSTEQNNDVIEHVLDNQRVLIKTKALTKEEIAARAANLERYNSLIK